MNKKHYFLLSLLFCIVLVLPFWQFAKPVSAEPVSTMTSYEAVNSYVEAQRKALNIPGGALAIIEGDRIVHVKNFGVSGPDGRVPTDQTPFFIGSLTKSFTALAVMQLVEAGKIDLDAPVQRYLPWFTLADPQAASQLTPRHLLNQTSGFSMTSGFISLVNYDTSPDATEKQARVLADFKPNRPVGAAFEYTNTNYNLLGLIIEAASGEKYADYVQTHIFDPLKMTHTYTSKAVARQNGLGSGYISWFGFPVAVPDLPYPSGALPSGQIISTTEDMAHYLIAQLNEGRYGDAQILSPAGIAAMHTPAADASTMGVKMAYGMGWFIERTNDGSSNLIAHDGTVPDYKAYMALLPDQKSGMVLLLNANELMMDFSLKFIGGEAASLLAGVQPQAIPWAAVSWSLRALLIIPVLQILGVFLALRAVRRWRTDANRRPGSIAKWLHIVLPTIPNLVLVFCALYFVTGGALKMWLYFMADVTWLTLLCGSFALVWILVRTRLILSALQTPLPEHPLVEQLNAGQQSTI